MSWKTVSYNLNKNCIVQYNYLKKQYKLEATWKDFRINDNTWFSDMVWDFSKMNINNRDRRKYIFDFNSIPEPYILYVKVIVFEELNKKKNKYNTVNKYKEILQGIIKELYESNITDVRLIDKGVIEKYIEKKLKSCAKGYIEKLAIISKKLIYTIIDIDGYELESAIKYLNSVIKLCYWERPNNAVNDYIPDKFFNQIVSLAIKDMDDEKLSIDFRIIACLIILLAETGMRAEELTLLETKKLDMKEVNGVQFCYLNFLTFKTGIRETYTSLSDKALKAYINCENLVNNIFKNLSESSRLRVLVTLHTKKELKRKINISELRKMVSEVDESRLNELTEEAVRYLFTSNKTGIQKKGGILFRENLERFFVRHRDDFDLENISNNQKRKIKTLKINSKSKYEKFFSLEEKKYLSFENVKNKEFCFVNPHMFRVTVCTKLFMQGVHLDFIVKHLNHLNEDMAAYYNKSEDFIDSLEEGTAILSSISNECGLIQTNPDLISDKFLKNEMKNQEFKINIEKINEFLKSNKLNIKGDLGKIIKLLEKTSSPIIENELGICIRSTINGLCERRKYFSSITDNYYLEGALPTYRYIHFAYERFQQKVTIVNHNKKVVKQDESYMLEFEREEKALKIFVKNNLMKQIVLLDNDISELGYNMVLSKYQQLKDILINLDNIRKEIAPWME